MKPILFSAPMVKALLNAKPGTWPVQPIVPSRPCKSQVRRIVKPQPEYNFLYDEPIGGEWFWTEFDTDDDTMGWWPSYDKGLAPRYQAGDKLWVRETWRCMGFDDADAGEAKRLLVQYKDETSRWVDFDDVTRWKKFAVCSAHWKSSIHMPREAARLFLEVREVRAERLRDISPEDARAEGSYLDRCECLPRGNDKTPVESAFSQKRCHIHGTEFRASWDAINAKKGCPWESDPWVWVCEFMRVEGQKHV